MERDGKRWKEMERDGARWKEMVRDGKRWKGMERDRDCGESATESRKGMGRDGKR